MPLQNRVLPTGEIVAHPARGGFVGNRGIIHRPTKTLGGRRWTTWGWVTCRLCFRGRHREVMGKGWTELFFLDEAVALAAGHRPCAECRRADYRRFQAAWQAAFDEPPTAPTMNARLHADRVDPATRAQRRHAASLSGLPDGCFVLHDGHAALVAGGRLWRFSPDGYAAHPSPPPTVPVVVLTPRCTVAVLAAGYQPSMHPSAAGSAGPLQSP